MAKSNRKIKLAPVAEPQTNPQPIDGGAEYVTGMGLSFAQYGTVLSPQPREECLDADVYRRMMHDPEVAADVWLLVNSALADGVTLSPKDTPEDDPRKALAQDIADFHARNLAGLPTPIEETIERMLKEAIQYGHKIAEQTFMVADSGPDAGMIRTRFIKVKSRKSVSFVVDRFWNVLGLRSNVYGIEGAFTIIPREKFVIVALREEDEDPRGMSWLRTAVNGWQFKCETWPTFHRYLRRMAIPSLVGKTAPKAPSVALKDSSGAPVLDSVTGKPVVMTAEQAMSLALVQFENGTVIVVPSDAEVDALEVQSQGEVYERTIDMANREITRGILYQTRATNEAQHGSKADSQTGATILDTLIWYLKRRVARVVLNDVIRPIHVMNFGVENLDLMPTVSLGDSERKDWATDAHAASEIAQYLTDSQWTAITTQLGIAAPQEGEELPKRGGASAPAIAPGNPQDNPPQDGNQPPIDPAQEGGTK